jgi:hypothetical protein
VLPGVSKHGDISIIIFITSSTSSARKLAIQTKWSIELVSLQFRVFSCITLKNAAMRKYIDWMFTRCVRLASWGVDRREVGPNSDSLDITCEASRRCH